MQHFLEPDITANESKLKNSSDSKHFGCSLLHVFVFGITNIYFALVCLHHVIAREQERVEIYLLQLVTIRNFIVIPNGEQ